MRSLSLPSDLTPAYGGCLCDCHRIPGVSHTVACCYPGSPSPSGSEAPDILWQGDTPATDAVIEGASASPAELLERAAGILERLSQCNESSWRDCRAAAALWRSYYVAMLAAEEAAAAPRNAGELAEYFSAHPIEPLQGAAPEHFQRPTSRGSDPVRPLDPGFAAFLEEAPAPALSAQERGRALLNRHRGAIDEVLGQARALREEHAAALRGIQSPELRALAQSSVITVGAEVAAVVLKACRETPRQRGAPFVAAWNELVKNATPRGEPEAAPPTGVATENPNGADAAASAAQCAPACGFYPDCRCGDEAGYRGK
jgi:hypothetical protein